MMDKSAQLCQSYAIGNASPGERMLYRGSSNTPRTCIINPIAAQKYRVVEWTMCLGKCPRTYLKLSCTYIKDFAYRLDFA